MKTYNPYKAELALKTAKIHADLIDISYDSHNFCIFVWLLHQELEDVEFWDERVLFRAYDEVFG